MKLRTIVLGALVACEGGRVPGSGSCEVPDDQVFEAEVDLTVRDVYNAISYAGVGSSDELDCESACASQASKEGIELRYTSACEMQIDETILASEANASRVEEVVGHLTCEGHGYEVCEGRRPLGHHEATGAGPTEVARTLAGAAYLEAASVAAFEQLADQLRGWGAPDALIRRCEAAAADERAHAEVVTALAEARGGRVPAVACDEVVPSLFEAALHNAVHGCVLEAWASLLAEVRARHAEEADVREAYATIALDEARHGELAWDLHRWFCGRLAVSERAAVVAAQLDAMEQLPELARRQVLELPEQLGSLGTEAPRVARVFASSSLAALA